jgi:membrane-bound metal-dependent hydrolase YbcI (DUF457 family)
VPTILSHPAVPLAIGLGLGQRVVPIRLLVAGVVASVVPDLDVVGLRLGIDYSNALGHRGISHSLLFALALGSLAALRAAWLKTTRRVAFGFIFASTASHGLLDMMTNGGLGIAIWWPCRMNGFSYRGKSSRCLRSVFGASQVLQGSAFYNQSYSGCGCRVSLLAQRFTCRAESEL